MKRILVADDKATSRELIREWLQEFGYHVTEAGNGEEVLLQVRADRPDLVLLDIQMPALDGFEVLRILRSDPEHHDLPIIALTASAMQGDRERGLAAGFTGYITKPVSLVLLQQSVEQVLGEGEQ